MPDITIHDVPPEELSALESRAARHGRSTEAELMHLIHEAASEEKLVAELERARREVEARLSTTTRSAGRRRYRVVEPTPRQHRS